VNTEPEGSAGSLDYWHGHEGLRTTGAEQFIREDLSAEECAARGGRYTGDLRWMAHVWVLPEVANNQDGVFAYLNANLFALQTRGSAAQAAPPSQQRLSRNRPCSPQPLDLCFVQPQQFAQHFVGVLPQQR
jgi:hypothetical protein